MLGVRKTKVRRSVEYYAKSSNTSDLHFIITHDILIRETSQQSWDLSWQQIITERISPTVKRKTQLFFPGCEVQCKTHTSSTSSVPGTGKSPARRLLLLIVTLNPLLRKRNRIYTYHRGIQTFDSVGFVAMDTRGWHGNRFQVMTPGITS